MSSIPAPHYNDTELRLNILNDAGEYVSPSNLSLREIAFTLHEVRAIRVHLEPGDMTRYTFVITKIGQSLYVIRLWGFDVIGAVCLPLHQVMKYEVANLVPNDSSYTISVMHWFLNHLIEAI